MPEELGQSMKCEVFEKAYDTTNLAGLQLLVRFLTSGKLREEDASLPQLINNSDRIPALLTLPEDLWTAPLLVRMAQHQWFSKEQDTTLPPSYGVLTG